jgi:carbon-monoxide dehydrogenase medium subunit
MTAAPFEYHAPTTVAEALATLADLGDDAKVLAGGQSLVPMLNLRLARFEHLVDIGRVDELRGIARVDGSLVVQAATRDAVIEFDPTVAVEVPLLAAVTPYIGHFQIRNRGTIGGSLVHADPAAEYPAVAVALDASFDVVSNGGARSVPAAAFFTGVWSTALEEGELLRSISFPVWRGRCGFGVAEFARRHGDFSIAGAVAAVELDDDDAVARCAIAMFGVAATPTRAVTTEAALTGQTIGEIDPSVVGRMVFEDIDDVLDDPQVPAGYRRRVGTAMVGDAWRRAVEHAGSPG